MPGFGNLTIEKQKTDGKNEGINKNDGINVRKSLIGHQSQDEGHEHDQLNNVMKLNQVLEEDEKLLDPVQMNPIQNMKKDEPKKIKLEIEKQTDMDINGWVKAEEQQELQRKLEELDKKYSDLTMKEQIDGRISAKTSRNTANFLRRYKKRNYVTEKMARAIRLEKNKLSEKKQGELYRSEAKQINELLNEAEVTKEEICKEDKVLASWQKYTIRDDAASKLMDEIEKDARLTDSGKYTDVCSAIVAYRENPSAETLEALRKYVSIYIDTRTKHGRKKDNEFRARGLTRINRMRNLLRELQVLGVFESQKEKMSMTEQSPFKEKTVNSKLKTFTDIEQQFADLRKANFVIITKDMLTREYYKKHKQEMQELVALYNKVNVLLQECGEKYSDDKEFVNPEDKIAKEIYEQYKDNAKGFVTNFADLGKFVQACEEKKDEHTINASLANMQLQEMNPKMKNKINEQRKKDIDRKLGKMRLFYICRGENSQELSDDQNRLGGMLPLWNVNEQGEFASEKDKEIFEKNLDFVDTFLNGDATACLKLVEDYIKNKPDLQFDEKCINRKYFEKYYNELSDFSLYVTNIQNIIYLRKDVAELFVQKHGEKRLNELKKGKEASVEGYISHVLTCVATVNGFEGNENKTPYMYKEDVLNDPDVMNSTVEALKDSLNNLKDVVTGKINNVEDE